MDFYETMRKYIMSGTCVTPSMRDVHVHLLWKAIVPLYFLYFPQLFTTVIRLKRQLVIYNLNFTIFFFEYCY